MGSNDQWEFQLFFDPGDSPFALQLPAVRAVQGDCERVYSGQPWEAVTQFTQQIPCRVSP